MSATSAGIAVPTPIDSNATRLISRTMPMVVARRSGPNSSVRTELGAAAVVTSRIVQLHLRFRSTRLALPTIRRTAFRVADHGGAAVHSGRVNPGAPAWQPFLVSTGTTAHEETAEATAVREAALRAVAAAPGVRAAGAAAIDAALRTAAELIRERSTELLAANAADVEAAERNGMAAGL